MAIFKNDIGTLIEISVTDPDGNPLDISSASSFIIYWVNPDGGKGNWPAELKPATTDTILYTTVADDINLAGDWRLQGYVKLPAWEGRTEIATMPVDEIVEDL